MIMDPNVPNTPQYPPSQPSVPGVPGSGQPFQNESFVSKILRKKILIVVGVLLVVIIGLSVFLFTQREKDLYPHYEFSINNEEISKDEFTSLYTHFRADKDMESDQIKGYIEDLYIEHYLLSQQYKGTLSSPSANLGNAVLDKLIGETTQMKQSVLPSIETESRSGKVFILSVTGPSSGEQSATRTAVVTNTLNSYRTQLSNGQLQIIENRFSSESASLKDRYGITSRVVTFENMSKNRPVIGGDSFITNAFGTKVGQVSNVFEIDKNDDLALYGIVYVTSAGEGEYVDYRDWFAKQKSKLDIKANFSDYK